MDCCAEIPPAWRPLVHVLLNEWTLYATERRDGKTAYVYKRRDMRAPKYLTVTETGEVLESAIA